VDALLPPLVQLECEGRYAAMLSHEPKNYALLDYDGTLILRGVAFRSSRAEPFGEAFLKRALTRLLNGDVQGVHDAYVDTVMALRRRAFTTREVSSRVRLTKTPEQYMETRVERRELPYEAMLASGHATWEVGDRVRVYRTRAGEGAVVEEADDDDPESAAAGGGARDYDVEHYVRVLRDNFASRLARALTPAEFAAVFDDPDQFSLLTPSFAAMRPILTTRHYSVQVEAPYAHEEGTL
jgi:DNA polymerase, archaea type